MPDVSTKLRVEPLRPKAILVLDDDQRRGTAVLDRIRAQFGETYQVRGAWNSQEAASLITWLEHEGDMEIPVVGIEQGVLREDRFGLSISDRVPHTTTIIAYVDALLEEMREQAIESGAITCVRIDDIEAAVHGVFLESELGGLGVTAPIAASVVNTINVNISIENPQMEVLWANDRSTSTVDESDTGRRRCWHRYHKFYNRERPCPGCTAWAVLQSAIWQVREGERAKNDVSPGYHLLPIRARIARVEINAAPLMSRDGGRVLAVIEATRFVTDEWEANTLARDRLHEVIAAARALGQERQESVPFLGVSIYYQPDKDADLHLFDSAAGDPATIPKLLRLAECHAAYDDALEDLQPQFYEDETTPEPRRHFLWADRTPSMGTYVLIDVVYAGDKPEGLLTDDLRPYWEYVIETFDTAWDTREKAIDESMNSFLQEFVAGTADGIRDEPGLDYTLEAAIECIKEALRPLSMHVRILDRTSSTLVMRNGFGPYYETAPKNRTLEYEGIGSSWAASTRQEKWNKRADLPYIRQCLGRELARAEEAEIQRIASDVLLPLVCMDRVLGTLCLQFDDDSLYSPAKQRFVEALANALGGVLGSREWAHQRAAMVSCSRELDRTMFQRSERPEDDEARVLAQVARMVFELTAAEVVTYYRYDDQTRTLTLVRGATQGALPNDTALPETVPHGLGIVSLAASRKQGYLARDYREDWQAMHKRLIARYPVGPENRFCYWVGSEVAEPVVTPERVKGVLVALSSIPRWLGNDDVEVVREFAFKTGLWLEAKQLTRQLNWSLRTRISLGDITARMARMSDVSTLYRLFLLAITANECLGFSRAILFLRQNGEKYRFIATETVGARSRSVAETRWEEAEAMSFEDKMEACDGPSEARKGDLREVIPQLVLDLQEQTEIRQRFREGKMVVRRHGRPHIVPEGQLRDLLCPEDDEDCEYVLAPLAVGGEVTGAVLADRAFLAPSEITPGRLELLHFLTGEFALMLEAVKLRREEEEAKIAKELARGISYSLKTRSAALEGRLSNFAHELGGAHKEAIDGLKRAVKFFGRAGTVASKPQRLEDFGPRKGEKLDVNTVLAEMVDALADPRVTLIAAETALCVQAERHYIEDILLEILWNACDFADRESGQITVKVGREEGMVRVDCVDNGRGIHPDFRQHLFKPFKCYPASRMGLGLSYAARIVEAYGGTVKEIGSWQQGAHFVVRIPLVKEEQDESG
jgi:signal transduction histidine kinase